MLAEQYSARNPTFIHCSKRAVVCRLPPLLAETRFPRYHPTTDQHYLPGLQDEFEKLAIRDAFRRRRGCIVPHSMRYRFAFGLSAVARLTTI